LKGKIGQKIVCFDLPICDQPNGVTPREPTVLVKAVGVLVPTLSLLILCYWLFGQLNYYQTAVADPCGPFTAPVETFTQIRKARGPLALITPVESSMGGEIASHHSSNPIGHDC
jgi:hypothetical protein